MTVHGPDLQQNHIRKLLQEEKKMKTTAFSTLSAPPTPDLTPASWSVDQRPACDLTTLPSAGLGGVSGIFMYPLHTHELMQVTTLALQVSVPFAHSPLLSGFLGPSH